MKYYIEYGYDRHVRAWCIIVFDVTGNEIESRYVGNLHSCEYVVNKFKTTYGTTDVRKVKAY